MRELLERILKFAQENYPVQMNGLIAEINIELAKPEPDPDYWHVVDEDGNSIYSASFKQVCHDHINDALNLDINAEKWIVEGLFVKPPAHQKPLSGQAIIECIPNELKPLVMGNEDSIFEFARAIEQAHGIK